MLTAAEKEIVRKARDRIADPERWCANVNAQTADGAGCYIGDLRARKFCAYGALAVEFLAVSGDEAQARLAVEELARRFDSYAINLVYLNDQQGHAAVLAYFDEVLAA